MSNLPNDEFNSAVAFVRDYILRESHGQPPRNPWLPEPDDEVRWLSLLNYCKYGESGIAFFYLYQTIKGWIVEGHMILEYTQNKWQLFGRGEGGRRTSDGPRPTDPIFLLGSGSGRSINRPPHIITIGYVNSLEISWVHLRYGSGDEAKVPVISGTFLAVVTPTSDVQTGPTLCEGLDDESNVLFSRTYKPHTIPPLDRILE